MPWNEPGSGGGNSGGNKDPWGNGNRGCNNSELDDIIDNVRKRFGGGGRSSNNGKPNKGLFSPFLIFIVFAGIYWATQSFYQVDDRRKNRYRYARSTNR